MPADLFSTVDFTPTQPESFAAPETCAEVVRLYLAGPARELVSVYARKHTMNDFIKHLGALRVADAKPFHLQLWIDRHPGWKSNWTPKRAIASVHACFNWAAKLGLIDRNPFKGFSWPAGERGDLMTDAEYQAILRSAPVQFRRLVIALRYSGARVGEMAKATLEDCDLARGCIELQQHKTRKKTGKPRVIPLHPVLVAYINWRARQQWRTRLLFPNSRWRKWSNPAICWRIKKARLSGQVRPETTLYSLRHAAITRLVLANVPLPVVAEIAGHGRIQTTMIYTHVNRRTDLLQAALKTAFQSPS